MPSETISKKISAKAVSKVQKSELKNSTDNEIKKLIKRCSEFNEESVIQSDSPIFEAFPLSAHTLKGLKKSNFIVPTVIQHLSLVHSLVGHDVVGAAKTGSGKTLAMLIPVLECLYKNRWTKFDGVGALIISPTRELAFQIYQVLNTIGVFHDFSVALLIGGTDVEYEKPRLTKMNIIICTPGRLLQHMDENEHFSCEQLQVLVIDEADRILDMGFRKQVDAILQNVPKGRQTLLFSATQTRKVEDLIRVSLKTPKYVWASDKDCAPTPDQLLQKYFICPEEDKLNALWTFITSRENCRKKSLVFVTCCKQARFIANAFCHLKPSVSIMSLWGDMKQTKRIECFQKFHSNKDGAVMIATDLASRGLDFEGLDCVLQFDCPSSVDDYIHRVGRTGRMDEKGEGILFLTPSQKNSFTKMLFSRKIPINGAKICEGGLKDLHQRLTVLLAQNPELKKFAQMAFVAYARAIYFMKLKEVFNVESIDFSALAKAYGLPVVPRIRFLRKRGVIVNSEKKTESEVVNLACSTSDLANGLLASEDIVGADEDSNEEFMKVVRRDVFNTLDEPDTNEDILSRISTKKPITKAELAKRTIKRMGLTSTRKRFFDESEDVTETDLISTIQSGKKPYLSDVTD